MAGKRKFHTVDPQRMAMISPLIAPWVAIKSQLSDIKSKEGMQRHAILDGLFHGCGKGTFNVDLGNGNVLKMTMGQEVTGDYPEWYRLAQSPEYALQNIPQTLWKHQDPILDPKVYETLTDEQKRFLANVITVKDKSRTLDFIPAKPEDAA